jgi:hypothetical protein
LTGLHSKGAVELELVSNPRNKRFIGEEHLSIFDAQTVGVRQVGVRVVHAGDSEESYRMVDDVRGFRNVASIYPGLDIKDAIWINGELVMLLSTELEEVIAKVIIDGHVCPSIGPHKYGCHQGDAYYHA